MRAWLRYATGEEIGLGDRVLYDEIPAQVELIASDPEDPDENWYIQSCGKGVMLIEPAIFGRQFTTAIEALEFVERGRLETSP